MGAEKGNAAVLSKAGLWLSFYYWLVQSALWPFATGSLCPSEWLFFLPTLPTASLLVSSQPGSSSILDILHGVCENIPFSA